MQCTCELTKLFSSFIVTPYIFYLLPIFTLPPFIFHELSYVRVPAYTTSLYRTNWYRIYACESMYSETWKRKHHTLNLLRSAGKNDAASFLGLGLCGYFYIWRHNSPKKQLQGSISWRDPARLFFTALGHSVNVREEPALSTGYLDLPQIQRKTLLQV